MLSIKWKQKTSNSKNCIDEQVSAWSPLRAAATVDAGIHFVKSTYSLEGDGPLIFSYYEHLSAVAQAFGVGHYPCTLAVAREIANADAAQPRLIDQSEGLNCG